MNPTKNTLSKSVLIIILVSAMLFGCSSSVEFEFEFYEFPFVGWTEYGIYKVKGDPGESVHIPTEHNGCPVTTILSDAFNHKSIVSVTMESIEFIGSNAFHSCRLLKEINFGCVKSIGNLAFSNCRSLTKVVFPPTLETILSGAFYDCPELREVHFQGVPVNLSVDAFDHRPNIVFYGPKGSIVEEVAIENGYQFVDNTNDIS